MNLREQVTDIFVKNCEAITETTEKQMNKLR